MFVRAERGLFMQKIKDDLLKKLFKYELSKYTLVLALDLLNIVNEKGESEVYYKDIIETVGCSDAQFYNALNALESFELIKKVKNDNYKNEIKISFIGNNFVKNGYNNYVDTNNIFFTNRMYASLKAGEIRTFLYFLFRIYKQKYKENNKKNKLYYGDSYDKVSGQLGVTIRMVKEYCKALKDKGYICVGEKKVDSRNKKYDVITINKEFIKPACVTIMEKGKPTETKQKAMFMSSCHFIKNLCRRNKKSYDTDNLCNATILINQYQNKAEKSSKNIYEVMINAIKSISDDYLDSKTLHSIVKSLININYADCIVAY